MAPGILTDTASRAAFAGYRPLPGVPDEFIGPDGLMRAHWRDFLSALDQQDIDRSIEAADRHIRDMGMSYRVHGETQERIWPLSRLPLLIEPKDWEAISSGVIQRARLMEAVLADVYGPARLVREGHLPAAAVAGSGDYLRPMAGMPSGTRWLDIHAVDLGRGPDGRWWVLGDRAQAPSGAGYSLENRLVLSRAYPALYRGMNVQRLAPFFRGLRAGLAGQARRAPPRICLLTPGPYSETYAEQAYLARYLGFLLVEGDDLVVEDGKVHVRTIAGLKRADVIWRRVDGDFVDPLELNAASRLGVAGLLGALRKGEVVVGNMPGSGLVESRALMGFTESLSRHVLGEDLKLPNVATWWCGQRAERGHVLDNLDAMAVGGAFSDSLPGFSGAKFRQPVPVADLTAQERARLAAAIETRGMDFVGQEIAHLSTMPVWQEGKLEPRPFVLRVFAAQTPDGWQVMPGGFCRVSQKIDARAVTMGAEVQSADVWVLSDAPVAMETLLPSAESPPIRRLPGNLPSRAAENLFWYGRYLERTEATLRLIRSLSQRAIDADFASGESGTPDRLRRLLVNWGACDHAIETAEDIAAVRQALFSPENFGSVARLVASARRAASIIRERLSVDSWQLVMELESQASAAPERAVTEAEAHGRADRLLHTLAALSGLAQENTNRAAGWRFLDMGRRVERGINACRLARTFAGDRASADDLDVLLDLIDSQITYRSRYLTGVALAPVRDMVMLDPYNPRSAAFQIDRLSEHIVALPVVAEDGMMEEPRRLIERLSAEAATGGAEDFDAAAIVDVEHRLMRFSDALGRRYFLPGTGGSMARIS